jgi:uncharacterized protein (DUF433 family)
LANTCEEKNNAMKPNRTKSVQKELVREMRGGEPYEYYPLGRHIVAAPGVCGGRPTFKYTRIEAAFVLDLLAAGWSIERVTSEYQASHLSPAAVKEAVQLAKKALVNTSPALRLAA